MKKSIYVLLLACISISVQSQRLHIDYSEIKKQISEPESEYFYPTLLERYNQFDSTLTTYEYALIYYGFSFQDDYIKNKPDEKFMKEAAETDSYEEVIEECLKILKKNPVSLDANNEIGYALFKQGKPDEEWQKYQKRYRAFRKVIASSGNGLTPETAFKVIYPTDEYNMLFSYFEIPQVYSQALVGLCDYYSIDASAYYQAEGIYFDISRKLIRAEQLLDEKTKK